MSRDERDTPVPSSPRGEGEGDTGEQGEGGRGSRKKGKGKRKAGKGQARGRGEGAQKPFLFAASYPDDPALDDLLRAFEAGDFGRVRREAPALAERTADPEVARAARDLRARLDPDPLALGLFVGTAILLAFLTAWAYGRGH